MHLLVQQRQFTPTLFPTFAIASTVLFLAVFARPQSAPPSAILFQNVRVFDGTDTLTVPMNVLVVGNQIAKISLQPIVAPAGSALTTIDGDGRTLLPGFIDVHVHRMFNSLPMIAVMTSDIGFVNLTSGQAATDMLMRGYTSVRDLGGPSFGLKRAIDLGIVAGPRIWPSGAMISQSGGHGDFRRPTDLPAAPDSFTYSERIGATEIADDPATVRRRVREQLALGASQIKLMAGGGVASSFDPIDVTQYSVEELHAAVEAAENWGTYVTVHAYTPRAVRQAIEAGVKCIDHGQLLDDATAKLMAEKGIWWSLQPFTDDRPSAYPEGSSNRIKQMTMFAGTDTAYGLAKKYRIKTAWGTDILFDSENLAAQNHQLTKMVKWYTPAEVLKMATANNAELLALSGPRNPYPGKLGVVEEGSLADLLLVNGDPIADIKLLEDPVKNLLVIMKDGKLYKSIVATDKSR
jgi:imidazolonepropionase-like amidohydrolase